MRAVKYFISRFEYAIKGNGTIKVNQNDLDALNQISEYYESNYKNTQLEDSLLLFYLLQNWKVENINNEKLKMVQIAAEKQGIFTISDSMTIFEKIGAMLKPKASIIKFITIELWTHQAMNKVPKEKFITEQQVSEIIEKELEIAKTKFPFIKQLNSEIKLVFEYSKGLSEKQREMLGLK